METKYYEAYYDKDNEMITNDNYSIIIETDNIKKALKYLIERNEKYYHLRWITEYEDDVDDVMIVRLVD